MPVGQNLVTLVFPTEDEQNRLAGMVNLPG